jgi:hypothetical protein
MLAGERGLATRYPELRGFIAIESPILSFLGGDEPELYNTQGNNTNWFQSVWRGINFRLGELRPKKITHIENIPSLSAPMLFLVSDRIRLPLYQEDRYRTILEVFKKTEHPAMIAALNGAGPLDYSDIPAKYPLYARLFPGHARSSRPSQDYAPLTASLMVNFALSVLSNSPSAASLSRQPIPEAELYLETRHMRAVLWGAAPTE